MKKLFIVPLSILLNFTLMFSPVSAGELDVLVEKLVDKGILTPIEADIIKDETKQQVAADLTAGKSYALPSWAQNLNVKQDFRLRHQWERKNSDTEGRNRTRIRYRLGLESKIADNVAMAAGLATGGTDSRSTNQTLEDGFSTPDIRLDYAYLEWTPGPVDGLTVTAGKHLRKPYLWLPTDMLWDGDINPEGIAMNYQKDLGDLQAWTNGAYWILEHDDQADPDPGVFMAQGGLSGSTGAVDAKGAVTYYDFLDIKDRAQIPNTGASNTLSGGKLAYDFNVISLAAEVGVKKLFGGLPFNADERIALFGEWVKNNEAPSLDTGYAVGVKLGHKKVKDPNSWDFKYQHVVLEKDAFVDFLPDSDRSGGDTNTESEEFVFNYAMKKNVIFGLDYYINDNETGASDKEHLVQADVLLKF